MILGPFLLLGLFFVCESHANNLIQRQSEGTSRSQGPEYISKPNKYCKAKIAEYSTLPLAQHACKADDACKAVGDHQCDGRFWTCENPNLFNSSSGSCSWLKETDICTDIKVVTKAYGRENSWIFGACSSAQEYQTSTTTNEQCCQPAGNYELVCKDSHGDGWHGGYLEINGQEYCKEFNTGKEKKEDATMANGIRQFYVDDGCQANANHYGDVPGTFQQESSQFGVRCCSLDGSSCVTPGSCPGSSTYEEAKSQCASQYPKRRLCTKNELPSDICCATGGVCDHHGVWTSTQL